jgi:hypothetical protein
MRSQWRRVTPEGLEQFAGSGANPQEFACDFHLFPGLFPLDRRARQGVAGSRLDFPWRMESAKLKNSTVRDWRPVVPMGAR